jgi:tRNA dimethylallyltransferase
VNTLYFIIGCTAGGKGSLGRHLAGKVGGQIVSVDSMKIYCRMDIGTAKPSAELRSQVPHHCIDIAQPGESFSVAQYLQAGDAAIAKIWSQGAVALAVGGTSLYLKALSEGLFEGASADLEYRARLLDQARTGSLADLHRQLAGVDPQSALRIHPNDERRIVRALEVFHTTGKTITSLQSQWDSQRRYQCVLIGLRRDKEDLNRRINLRVKNMVAAGLRDEVAGLLAGPGGLSPQAAQAVGYAEVIEHLRGRCSYDQAIEQIKINTRRLAKKQRTWQRVLILICSIA